MSMEISYPNTGLISPNYDAINKANKIFAGKTAEDLKANTSGTMQELSTEEVREMREKARNEQRTLNVDRSEIVNNVYWKTGDNITYNVDGVSFTNEEMKACKEVVKYAIAALPTKGSDLDYEDYAVMGIAINMVNTYATEHLTEEQAEVVNKSTLAPASNWHTRAMASECRTWRRYNWSKSLREMTLIFEFQSA